MCSKHTILIQHNVYIPYIYYVDIKLRIVIKVILNGRVICLKHLDFISEPNNFI